MNPPRFADIFHRGLIVSCQAPEGDPLCDPAIMAAMARAAERAGAVGIRANGFAHVARILAHTRLPVIAINKRDHPGSEVRITPTFADAHDIGRLRPHAIAIDATARPRPGGEDLAALIRRIHTELNLPVMADVATHDEGLRAAELGADAVATTLSGYTRNSPKHEGPDLALVESLSRALDIPVVAEGRYWTPEEAAAAIERGAHAVVVGTAITRPQSIAERFVARIQRVL